MLPVVQRHRRGIRGELERRQAAEAALREGGHELQGALVTARTSLHVEGDDPFEPPGPAQADQPVALGRQRGVEVNVL